MAAVAEISGEAAAAKNSNLESKKITESEFNVQKLVDMFTKLNPLAKEFFPSSFSQHHHNLKINHQFSPDDSLAANNKQSVNDNYPNSRRVLILLISHLIPFFLNFFFLIIVNKFSLFKFEWWVMFISCEEIDFFFFFLNSISYIIFFLNLGGMGIEFMIDWYLIKWSENRDFSIVYLLITGWWLLLFEFPIRTGIWCY